MIRVVMMTLGMWGDCGEEMNQEEADQDVADKVSEEVDSRGTAMRSEENDWYWCKQVANLLCAQANSASYPQRDGKWVVAYGLRGEGLCWLGRWYVC